MATVDPGVVWFTGLGFRPAVWTPPHRADGVDPDRLIPSPDSDTAYAAKWDASLADSTTDAPGYAWGTWLPSAPAPQITAASLAGPVVGPQPWTLGAPRWPTWPGVLGGSDYPCQCIVPPVDPVPPLAPVPVAADAALFLLTALAVLFWRRIA